MTEREDGYWQTGAACAHARFVVVVVGGGSSFYPSQAAKARVSGCLFSLSLTSDIHPNKATL